jgi:hypothetical protein
MPGSPTIRVRGRHSDDDRSELMKFALITDAWKPQVQRCRADMGGAGRRVGSSRAQGGAAHARSVSDPAVPDAAGGSARLSRAARIDALAARTGTGCDPLLDRRIVGSGGPCVLPEAAPALYHGLPYPPSGIPSGRFGVPVSLGYAAPRRFHVKSSTIMVATKPFAANCAPAALNASSPGRAGVDVTLFRPGRGPAIELSRPLFLYVGRVAAEKNLPGVPRS